MIEADEKLKQFMMDNFDFDGMKEIGFWPKGTKRKDYAAQAARVCHYFGFKSVYEYRQPEITDLGQGAAIAEVSGAVDQDGAYVQGAVALLNIMPSEFECPVCTCPQTVGNCNGKAHKCTGCKRKLHVVVPLFGSAGSIEVSEW